MRIFKKTLLLICVWVMPVPALWAAGTTLVPSLGLDYQYNDNILFNDQEKFGDTIWKIAPGLLLDHDTEKLKAALSAQAVANRYRTYDELDGTDQYYDGRLQYYPNETTWVSASAGYRVDTQIDRDLDVTGQLLTNATRDRVTGDLGLKTSLSEAAGIYLYYDYLQDTFDEPLLSDSNIHNGGLSFSHNLERYLPRSEARLDLSYGRYNYQRDYTNQTETGGGVLANRYDESTTVDNFGLSLGLLYDWAEQLDLRVDLGGRYTEIAFDQQVTQTFSAPPQPDEVQSVTRESTDQTWAGTGLVQLAYVTEKTRTQFKVSNNLMPASGNNSPSVRNELLVNFSWRILENFWGRLLGQYFRNNSGINPFDLNVWESQTFQVRPSVEYRFNRYFSCDIYYSYRVYQRRESADNDHRNLVNFRLKWQYPLFE